MAYQKRGAGILGDQPAGISFSAVERRLSESRIEFARLVLDGGWCILVSSRGGRVYGPFPSDDSWALNSMPNAFGDEARFADLVQSRSWNLGGERIWVGPEIRYAIRDRADIWGSYGLSAAMDPGNHCLTRFDSHVTLSSEFTLESFLAPRGAVDFFVETAVCAVPDPLGGIRSATAALATVEYGGYGVTVTLRQNSVGAIPSESWNINQVRPGGTVLIPSTPAAEITDYFEPSSLWVRRVSRGLEVEISGDARFKVGTQAAQTFGRAGYISRADPSVHGSTREPLANYVLAVRSFANDLTADYIEEPHHSPGHRGDSMHFYSDDGGLGGFGELEAHGQTTGKAGGETHSIDRFTTYWYRGTWDQLAEISNHLLGMIPAATKLRPGSGGGS